MSDTPSYSHIKVSSDNDDLVIQAGHGSYEFTCDTQDLKDETLTSGVEVSHEDELHPRYGRGTHVGRLSSQCDKGMQAYSDKDAERCERALQREAELERLRQLEAEWSRRPVFSKMRTAILIVVVGALVISAAVYYFVFAAA